MCNRNRMSYLEKARKTAEKHGYERKNIFPSTRKDKKFMYKDNERTIHFGAKGYEDFLVHQDKERRRKYDIRSRNIDGNWRNDKYSANNLARRILWDLQ